MSAVDLKASENATWPSSQAAVQAVRAGALTFTAGQVALGPRGEVLHPGDLGLQIGAAVANLEAALRQCGAGLAEVVKIIAFFVPDRSCDERDFTELLARALPAELSIALCVVPVTALPLWGLRVQLQAIAIDHRVRRTIAPTAELPPLPRPFVHGVRGGEMIFPSAQSARLPDGSIAFAGDIVAQSKLAMNRLEKVLRMLGADLDDVVKQNRWASGDPSEEAWKPAALAVANRYSEPGPVATGIDIPEEVAGRVLIKIDVIAMRGADGARLPRTHAWPQGHWDWPIHLTYKHGCRCGDFVFVGGQVSWDPKSRIIDPGAMIPQTRRTMENIARILGDLGAGMTDVVLVTSFYNPTGNLDDTEHNWATCRSAFPGGGPAFVAVPNLFPTYPDMLTEIEAIAYIGQPASSSQT